MITIRFQSLKFDPGEPGIYLKTDEDLGKELSRRMTRAQFGAKRMVRKRTGRLAASIRKEPPRADGRSMLVDVKAGWTNGRGKARSYLGYEHDGTVPHIIRARRRRGGRPGALRFVMNGQVVFRTQVRHPGTTGTKFMTRALPLAGGG